MLEEQKRGLSGDPMRARKGAGLREEDEAKRERMSWTVVKEGRRYSEHGSLGDSRPAVNGLCVTLEPTLWKPECEGWRKSLGCLSAFDLSNWMKNGNS